MWTRTDYQQPPENVLLDVITETGDQRQLIFSEGLFFIPDKSMYVYFVPTFWREANEWRTN